MLLSLIRARKLSPDHACLDCALVTGMTETCGKISMSILPAPGSREREALSAQELMELVCTSGRPFHLIKVCAGHDIRGTACHCTALTWQVVCTLR